MDQLIKGLKKFSLNKNEEDFETLLDDSICKMCNLMKTKNDIEWETLKSNYSKLRYLNYIIQMNNLQLDNHNKFMKSLGIFMEYIDTITLHYFKEINWDYDKEVGDKVMVIKELFEKSLNSNNSIEKMKYVLDAYLQLVPIVEQIRNERVVEIIDDQSFLEKFNLKKAKLN